MPNILLIDNDKMVASALARTITGDHCVQLAHNMADMKQSLTQTSFDLAVLDVRMNDEEPDIHFLDVLLAQKIPVLVLTGQASKEEMVQYIRKGALGLIRKEDLADNLHRGVAALLLGHSWIPKDIAEAMRKELVKRMLTPREQDILDYFFLDAIPKNNQIAQAEGISVNTVRNYVAALMLACGVNSRHFLKNNARMLGYAPSGRKIIIKR